MKSTRFEPDRFDLLVTAWIILALFFLYAWGACRTIYVGDSGELVSAVYLLGIPHPSGYPLYVILGKLWTLLVPVGSIAFRMSLFSAVCAALSCGLLYYLCRRIHLHRISALLGALLLAWSPSFWSQANIQRVYSLNALFVVLATLAVVDWIQSKRHRSLIFAFFLCGLGACNHTFMGVYGVALSVYALLSRRARLRQFRLLVGAGAAVVVGLLPYLYLPLRSRANPVLDWGNPETLENFVQVVLRRDFVERAWMESPMDFPTIAFDYVIGLGNEFLWIGLFMAVGGLYLGRKAFRGIILLALLVMLGNLLVMALHGSRSDLFIWHRYYIPSSVMLTLLAAMGCHHALGRLPGRLRWLPLLLPFVMFVLHRPALNRSRYEIGEDYNRSLLESLPPGAKLSATDDNILFGLIYLHHVEGVRPDIELILQGVGGAVRPPLKFDPDRDRLFFTHHPNWNVEGLEVDPVGQVFRITRAGQRQPEPLSTKRILEGEQDASVPKDYLTQNVIGHFHYMLGVTHANRDWLRAREEFEWAAAAAPHNDVLFYNTGLIFQRNGLIEEALKAFERSYRINPRHIASKKRVRALERLEQLRAELDRLRTLEHSLQDRLPSTIPVNTIEYHHWMAGQLQRLGEFERSTRHLRKAVEREAGFQTEEFR